MTTRQETRIVGIIDLIASAASAEALRRSFFQLNDDLARTDLEDLLQMSEPDLPARRSRAALIAAAFAFRYNELGAEPPAWLKSSEVIAPAPVFLTEGFHDLTEARTPPVVSRYNIFVDDASFRSV